MVNERSYCKPTVIESKGVRYDLTKSGDPKQSGAESAVENAKEKSRPEKPAKSAKNSSQTKSVFDLIPEIPADIKLIIEKLAQYVAKNGDEFEKTIKARNESRFEFLNSGHKFHFYYVKTKFQLLEEKRKKEDETVKKNGGASAIGEARKAPDQPSSSNLRSAETGSNPTGDPEASRAVQPFVIVAKKSTSFKEDLEAKLLKEKQEERKRKAAEFLNKMKQQKSEEKSPEKEEELPNSGIIGPQLPADKRREDLRNTPSPLREFYDDLEIKLEPKQSVFDELKSIKDKLWQDDEASSSPEREVTSFKKTAAKNKQYRVRERSPSDSERSTADSGERGRRSRSKPSYDAYQPHADRRTDSRSSSPRRRSRSQSDPRSSRHHSRESRSRSRSVKRKKSHRSKKRKRSRSRRRSRDRHGSKDGSRSKGRSKNRSSSRNRPRGRPRSRS